MDLQGLIDLFDTNFEQFGELGASVSIRRDGNEILNLAGGYIDREKTRRWTNKTPVLIWSATKGLASACLIHAASEQGIDLESKVNSLWPDYGQNGKGDTTLLHVLTHQAGQPALRDASISILDHHAVVAQLARQTPYWKPGEAHGYHARTFGFLVDELTRRITGGATLGDYFRAVFGNPLGLDLWIGTPAHVENQVAQIFPPRTARVPAGEEAFYKAFTDQDSLTRKAFSTPAGLQVPSRMNDPKVRQHSLPSFGGIGTAEALARFYETLWWSDTIFSADLLRRISTTQCSGKDKVLLLETAYCIGFMKDPTNEDGKSRRIFGPELNAFGQPGSGGSLGFCDPKNRIAFAYVMNQMEQGVFPNEKSLRLVDLLYEKLGVVR
jgi:CubicO group peptidase (beta-lactamase class C family)